MMKRETLTITCGWFKINIIYSLKWSPHNQPGSHALLHGQPNEIRAAPPWVPVYYIYYHNQQNVREVHFSIVRPELHRLNVWVPHVPSPIDTYSAEIWTLSKMEVYMLEGALENFLYYPGSLYMSSLSLTSMIGSISVKLVILQRNWIICLDESSLPKRLLGRRIQNPRAKYLVPDMEAIFDNLNLPSIVTLL